MNCKWAEEMFGIISKKEKVKQKGSQAISKRKEHSIDIGEKEAGKETEILAENQAEAPALSSSSKRTLGKKRKNGTIIYWEKKQECSGGREKRNNSGHCEN